MFLLANRRAGEHLAVGQVIFLCYHSEIHLLHSQRNKLNKRAAAVAAKSLQSCPTLCDPIDGSLPGSPVPGILQARIVEWVAIPFSRGSSQPRDRTRVSHNAGIFFTI